MLQTTLIILEQIPVTSSALQPHESGGYFFVKEIKLTKGYVALVDDEDFEWLNSFRWYAKVETGGYVRAEKKTKEKHAKMHRFIMGVTDPKVIVDHRDRNPLNNQRRNLRICSDSQSVCNVRSARSSTSKFLGVSWCSERKKWVAQITKNYKQIPIGRFVDEKEAALAYNAKAAELHGEFANLNVIE